MSLPFISCVTLAYGNVSRLQEALACFLNQDYAGPREMLILNSLPQQTLKGTFPNVRILNLPTRPASLAACRNYAIASCRGDVIATWDADDLWLPHHLSVIGEAFSESNADWVRLNPVFYSEGFKIQKTFNTWINAISFTKKSWEAIGHYPHTLSVGEDQAMWAKLSDRFNGVTVELQPNEVTAIYSWGNGAFHISGKGWDKPGQTNAYERSRLDMEKRLRDGSEPQGGIVLQPVLQHDPVKMAQEFLSVKTRVEIKKNSVCIVELGRYGDIVNILPIARHIAQTYDTPHIMVSREFADLLEGVSYVKSYPVDLRNDQLMAGILRARKLFKHVIVSQIWGTGWSQERKEISFNRESWRVSGFNYRFNDFSPAWLPWFDGRDRKREAALVEKYKAAGKPLLLVNVTHSASSPFPGGQALLTEIRKSFADDYEIIDCGTLKLERIYDVMGLMDAAEGLVSIDTALLHLAAGTRVKTIALVNDKPWQGSEIRGYDCVLRLPYNEVTPGRVLNAIRDDLLSMGMRIPPQVLTVPPERMVYHCVERHHEGDPRKQRAWASWDALYRNGDVIPCHLWEPYPRNAKETIGDKRALPYLKDALRLGMDQANDDDIILWSNDDNVLHPEVIDMVRLHCSLHEICCSQRCEFKLGHPSLSMKPEQWAAKGETHMGRDLFAFTKRWLVAHWDEIPDFILGASDFDLMLACMVRLQWGIESNRQNLEEVMWPAELNRGYVAHEYHFPRWARPDNQFVAPSQKHNRSLFKAWAATHLPKLKFLAGDVI